MNKKSLEWIDMEIERTDKELLGYYKSLKFNIEEHISGGNLVELIRAAQVKLRTLEQCKWTYEAYCKMA